MIDQWFNIFNTRESAVIIWLFVAMILCLFTDFICDSSVVRNAFKNLMKAFLQKHILYMFLLMILYVSGVVYFLSEAGVWDVGQLKNTILWTIFVGFITLLKVDDLTVRQDYLKHFVLSNLSLMAMLEFFVGVATFPLLIELFAVLFITILCLLVAVSSNYTSSKYVRLRLWAGNIIAAYGVCLVFWSCYNLMFNSDEFLNEDVGFDFLIPTLLTITYLPFALIFKLYVAYESSFNPIKIYVTGRRLQALSKLYAIVVFNFNIGLLQRWVRYVCVNNIRVHDDLVKSIKYVFKERRVDSGSNSYIPSIGWNVIKAKKMMEDYGLNVGKYNSLAGDSWTASSPLLETNEVGGFLENNIAYYLQGDEDSVLELKLKANINHPECCEETIAMLKAMIATLVNKSLGVAVPNKLFDCLEYKEIYEDNLENSWIQLSFFEFPRNNCFGYEIILKVSAVSFGEKS